MWNNWKETKSNFEYLSDWWDNGKMMLKNECIQLSTEINLTKKKEIKDIEKTLSHLNATLNLSDLQWEQKLKLESKLQE